MHRVYGYAPQGQQAHSPGQAKRHPGYNMGADMRPERAKALKIRYLHCVIVCFCPFRARAHTLPKPGVPLRLPRAMGLLPLRGVPVNTVYLICKCCASYSQMPCILFANAVYLIYKNIAPDFQSITICVLWDVICTVCEYLRQNTSPYVAKPPLAAGGAKMAHFRLKQDALTVRYLRNGRIKAACK